MLLIACLILNVSSYVEIRKLSQMKQNKIIQKRTFTAVCYVIETGKHNKVLNYVSFVEQKGCSQPNKGQSKLYLLKVLSVKAPSRMICGIYCITKQCECVNLFQFTRCHCFGKRGRRLRASGRRFRHEHDACRAIFVRTL